MTCPITCILHDFCLVSLKYVYVIECVAKKDLLRIRIEARTENNKFGPQRKIYLPHLGLGLAFSNMQYYYKLRPEIMLVLGLSVQIFKTFLYITVKLGLLLLCTQSLRGLV